MEFRGFSRVARETMPLLPRLRRGAVFALLICLAAGAARAGTPLTEAGVREFQAQHYPAARALLEAAVREDASDARAAGFLGRVFFEENEAERAIPWLEKASALDSKNPEYPYWLGRSLGQQAIGASMFTRASLAGRIRRAFQRSVDLDPDNLDARIGLLEFYLRAPAFMGGSFARAKSEAEQVRRRDRLRGHRAMARLYEQQKNWEEAAAEYRKAIAEFPPSREPYFWMSRSAIDRKDWDAAFRGMDRLLELFPRDAVPLYETGRIAALSGRQLELGEDCLRRYIAGPTPKDPEPSLALAHARLAQIAERRGDRETARRESHEALRLDPGVLEARETWSRVR